MFKLLHLADLHLGVVPGGSERRSRDFDRNLREVIKDIQSGTLGIDVLILAGDLFDQAHILPDDFALFRDLIDACSRASVDVVAIEGNHDSVRRDRIVRRNLRWIDLFGGTLREIPDDSGVPGCHFLQKMSNGVMETLSICPVDFRPRQDIRDLLERMPSGYCHVLVLHQSMEGAIASIGNPEVDQVNLADKALYVALGDIHQHGIYQVSPGTVAAYPGPLEWVRTSESSCAGGLLVSIDPTALTVSLERYTIPSRNYIVIDAHPGSVVDARRALKDLMVFGQPLDFRVGGSENYGHVAWSESTSAREADSRCLIDVMYPHTVNGTGKSLAESVATFLETMVPLDCIVRIKKMPGVDAQAAYIEGAESDETQMAGDVVTMVQAIEEMAEDDSPETRLVTRVAVDLWHDPGRLAEIINSALTD